MDIPTQYADELKQLMRLVKAKSKDRELINYLNDLFAKINVIESIAPYQIVELSGLGIFKYADNIIARNVEMFLERSDEEWYKEINDIENESKSISESEDMSEEEKRGMLTIIKSISKIWTSLKDNEQSVIFDKLDNLLTLYSKYRLMK